MNQIGALLWKDVRLHARFAGTYLIGWPILMRVLIQWQHAMGLSQLQSVAAALVPTAISFSSLFAILLAQALIERERDKGTWAWVRTLPVSDFDIVLAKFAVVFVFGLATAGGWWIALQGVGLELAPWQAVSTWLVWWAFAGVAVFSQVLLSGRLAAGAPALLVCVGLAAAFRVSRSPDAVVEVTNAWNDPYAHIGLWAACLGVELCAVAATYARFHAQDSDRLVE